MVHHFAKMYESKSRRHDSTSDSAMFNEAVGALTGMLYSIVTLKAFFPSSKSPAKITDNTVTHAPYPYAVAKNGGSKVYPITPMVNNKPFILVFYKLHIGFIK